MPRKESVLLTTLVIILVAVIAGVGTYLQVHEEAQIGQPISWPAPMATSIKVWPTVTVFSCWCTQFQMCTTAGGMITPNSVCPLDGCCIISK